MTSAATPSAYTGAEPAARGIAGIRCVVEGKVQGVWFRAGTAEQAQRLGIVGSARNLADGRVEVLAYGTQDALSRLVEWLWQGPPLARVAGVAVERLAVPDGLPQDFGTA